MPSSKRLAACLLLLRLTIGAFFLMWASLKFHRPEWMVNVFKNNYGQTWVSKEHAFAVGMAQMAVVVAFLTGTLRTYSYGFMALMQATGLISAHAALANFTKYPNNLLWTSVPTLGALIVLFVLREPDTILNVSQFLKSRRNK